jgi:crossover junction endodeoxyribonuclease RuvC
VITIGIDPGLSGAIAAVDQSGHYEVHDLPVQRDKSLAWIDGAQLGSIVRGFGAAHYMTCIIERVSAMPKQGVASSFGFGVNFGSVLGVIQGLGIRLDLVTPAKWKREMGLGAEKHASLHKARLLFPKAELHLCKHDGRAEALLIAHWYLTRQQRAAA